VTCPYASPAPARLGLAGQPAPTPQIRTNSASVGHNPANLARFCGLGAHRQRPAPGFRELPYATE